MANQPKKYTKFVATAATATLVASAIVPVASASFTDVSATNSHAANIDALVEAKIIGGYADGTFKPNQELTRGQVVKMLGKWVEAQGFAIPADYATVARFTDVAVNAKDQELVKYAALVKETGVFNGSNGALNAAGTITRENMAVTLDRAFKAVNGTSLVELAADIEDVKVADLATAKAEARTAVQAIRDLGISGVENFNPKAAVTRGQFATFLNKTINVEVAPSINAEEVVVTAEEAVKALPKTVAADQVESAKASVASAKEAIIAAKEAIVADKALTEATATALTARVETATKAVEATEVVIEKAIEDAKALTVEAVTAINATQVEVKFSKAVEATSIFTDTTAKELKANVVTLKGLDKTTEASINAVELSADGKTLTLTVDTGLEGRYDVTIDKATDLNGKALVKYEGKNLDFGKDTVAPVITGVEKVNSSTFKVNFSEPLSNKGSWTFADAKGAVDVNEEFKAGDAFVTLTVGSDVKAGAEVTATVIGAKDQGGNLVNPNPTSVKLVKGDKDGVAPTVASVTPKALNKFEIKFSEEVQGLTAANIFVGGTVVAEGTKIEVSKTDKTVYTVTLATDKAAGLHKVEVKSTEAAALTDLSGEALTAFSQLVEFKADTVVPNFVSSAVVVDADTKKEKLVLTFDKEVTEVALANLVATELNKEFVTTTALLTAGTLKVNSKNEKQLEVNLEDITFNSKALVKDAKYTVTFAKATVTGTNAKEVAEFKVNFTRGTDGTATTTDKPEVKSATATGSNTVTVVFDKAVEGSTATTVANYAIPGLVIESAVLSNDKDGVANTVTLTIKKGDNKLNGDRDLTIANVKAKNGEVMTTVTKTVVEMKENVAPTVSSVKFTGTNPDGAVDEITVTFSEAVTVSENAFEFFIGDVTTAIKLTNTKTEATKTVVLTVAAGSELTTEQIAKTITVALATGAVIEDEAGNALDFKSAKASN